MSDLSLIRDQVCVSANVHPVATEAGFVPSQQRRGWYHHGTGDKSPSAHELGDGLFCFHCNQFFSVVDLCMLRDGHSDYIKALQVLATETGIEWRKLSPKDRAQKRADTQRAQKIASDAADWINGIHLTMVEYKSQVMTAAFENWSAGNDSLGDALAAIVERIPRAALSPQSADPSLIVAAYRQCALADPDATRRMMQQGREEREGFEAVAHSIVELLAQSQQERAV